MFSQNETDRQLLDFWSNFWGSVYSEGVAHPCFFEVKNRYYHTSSTVLFYKSEDFCYEAKLSEYGNNVVVLIREFLKSEISNLFFYQLF